MTKSNLTARNLSVQPVYIRPFSTPTKHQKSISWVADRLGCEEKIDYQSKVHAVLDFKIFLQKFILSIDPSFDKSVIDAAYYRSKQANGEALVYLKSAEDAVEIETKLSNVKVRDMFPGNFS